MEDTDELSEKKTTITPREDGPLIVKNLQTLAGSEGPIKPVVALCRCGNSKNKPFCDGSHKAAGFSSDNGRAAGRDRMIKYEGTSATVFYNPLLCGHAAECGRIASDIFNPAHKPWIQPNNGSQEQVRAVVAACPSGALTLADDEGVPAHIVEARPQISVEKNGPYWVTDVEIEAPLQGEGMSARKYVLCRCGQSGNKPFCDGTHRDKGWKDGS